MFGVGLCVFGVGLGVSLVDLVCFRVDVVWVGVGLYCFKVGLGGFKCVWGESGWVQSQTASPLEPFPLLGSPREGKAGPGLAGPLPLPDYSSQQAAGPGGWGRREASAAEAPRNEGEAGPGTAR